MKAEPANCVPAVLALDTIPCNGVNEQVKLAYLLFIAVIKSAISAINSASNNRAF